MSHHFDTRIATRDPRLNVADAYLFDAAPDRTVMVMTCSADAGVSAPPAFHPAALYEFRFDTTGNGHDDIGFQVRFTEPIQRTENGPRQEFTVHYVTGVDLDVDHGHCVVGKPVLSAELNSPRRVGAVDGFAGLVGDVSTTDASALSTMLGAFYLNRRFKAAYVNRCNLLARRNVMAIVLEVPNALIGDGQVAMWSSISLCGYAVKAQVSRSGYRFSPSCSCHRGARPSSSAITRSAPDATSNCLPNLFAALSPSSPRTQDWGALVSPMLAGLPHN